MNETLTWKITEIIRTIKARISREGNHMVFKLKFSIA